MQHLSIKATQLCPSSSTTAKNKDIAKLAKKEEISFNSEKSNF